eukprot:3935598-Rhodomonas_salina.4
MEGVCGHRKVKVRQTPCRRNNAKKEENAGKVICNGTKTAVLQSLQCDWRSAEVPAEDELVTICVQKSLRKRSYSLASRNSRTAHGGDMSAGAETARLFTLGHSNLSAEAFIGLLAMHGVTMVFDVRSAPYSARFPHFKKKILKVLCEEHGMQYSHVPQLGGQDPGGVVVKMKEPKGVEALQNLAAAAAGTRVRLPGLPPEGDI